eukprot:scaffold81878_cov14-Tisochrysis_lutea.AAC.1
MVANSCSRWLRGSQCQGGRVQLYRIQERVWCTMHLPEFQSGRLSGTMPRHRKQFFHKMLT